MGTTRAAGVLVAKDYTGQTNAALIRCEDPYFAFRQAMVLFYGFRRPDFEGISPQSSVHESARLAEGVRVAPFVTVSRGCSVGEGTTLYPGVYVGANCKVGRDCTLYPNVVLYDGCILGDRVTIHAGSSVGHDGFGYATHDGRHEKIPQAGWVELEDDVEIGACCTIDRATMGATIVGAGSKFSNLVAVGHGTRLGKHCLLVAQAGLAGSVVTGDYCVLAGQSGVVGHVRLGKGVRVCAQAGVTNDVADGMEVWGSPAIPSQQGRRALATLPQLPQMRSAIRRLTREVNALKRRLRAGGVAEEPP
jgi:UDP-3-O-[3-hydroxymyristoyl] glucosamine N-acyltransferase